MSSEIVQTSLSIERNGHTLHLRHIVNPSAACKGVLLFVHGAIENGRVFYTHSNKGLAPFLAENGFSCYVLDLRGRGNSHPRIDSAARFDQRDSVIGDIPAAFAFIREHSGFNVSHIVAHSWGGVLVNAAFARDKQLAQSIKSCVYFGTKRQILNRHPSRFLQINLVWQALSPLLVKYYGFLPAKQFRFGADNESALTHQQGVAWLKSADWQCPIDGFDYKLALKERSLPPTLHIAAIKDKALAQPIDIKAFMSESGIGTQTFKLYGKKFGHGADYDHISMLTAPQARGDIYLDCLAWLTKATLT